MENLVIYLKKNGDTGTNLSNYKFVVLGSSGYIGSNLCRYLENLNIPFDRIDTRVDNLERLYKTNRLLIIDCSRIKSFDSHTIETDSSIHIKTLSFLSASNGYYFRIGSTLELDNSEKSSDYISWSRNRTRLTETFGSTLDSMTMFVPNIYGGTNSTSVVDLMASEISQGRKLALYEPNNFRDFLHIKRFFESLDDALQSLVSTSKTNVVITSGVVYQVESIQNYIYDRRPLLKKGVTANYNGVNQVKILFDDLPRYLSDF